MGPDRKDDSGLDEGLTEVERPPRPLGQDDPLPAGAVLAGRYEIRKTIGRGGMGVVVEALDRALGLAVAIKIVRGEFAGERRWTERLAREVKLARQIQHPNVCRVFDYAQDCGRAFLSMELADGGTLRSALAAGSVRGRPLAERLADARAIAAGVAAIHAAGIVHRDISPQNALRMSDGRLVVSDFGLATDVLDGSTSIHGGTVAYMAPEILRGGRATFAADIWALGAVIHEVVLGERLTWEPKAAEMRSTVEGGTLTRAERSVLELCRECTSPNPARRPREAAVIAARLSEAALTRATRRRWGGRAAAASAAGLLLVGAIVGIGRVRLARRRAAQAATASADPLTIIPTGEPDDWTDKAKVLAEVPEKIRCVVGLPDHHTVRFVWGYPAQAVDVDTRTGERRPSPLVPEAYAEGCPDLSPDGRWLVFAGHTSDDRAFAFVSSHADGRDATPEVPIEEPAVNSDPVWLSDGVTFVYDADNKHVGAFSLSTKRSVIMPTNSASLFTSFHHAIGSQIFVISVGGDGVASETVGFTYPRLDEAVRWRSPAWTLDLQSSDGVRFYGYSPAPLHGSAGILEVIPGEGRARFVGSIKDQIARHPMLVEGGLVLTSARLTPTLVFRSPGEKTQRVPADPGLSFASACGRGIIGMRWGSIAAVWVASDGTIIGDVGDAQRFGYPRCSADGKVVFHASPSDGIVRCEGSSCRSLLKVSATELSLSPDERRVAFVTTDVASAAVAWVAADGVGGMHQIVDAETGCEPIWSSPTNLWVSVRRGRRVIWEEMDTDTQKPTGRTALGRRDCTDGYPDPDQPLHDPIELEVGARYQLRFLPAKFLPAE